MIYRNILQTIGQTPLVKINKLCRQTAVRIYAKIEGVNPGGSIKDRIVLKMIEEAEANGKLNKDKVMIEATSGNTGIALAMIGAVKGYRVEIVMSEAVSTERRNMIKAFGARLVLTPAAKGTDGAIMKVRELLAVAPDKYFCPDQFSNEYNKIAHYEGTAQEIWHQTNGEIDYFVSSIGTSGTLMGVAAYLKKYNPKVKIVSAEPERGHYIQGLKNMEDAIVPTIYDREKLDEIIMVKTEEAYAMSREIVRQEGIFVGMSSGAAMLAALKVADKIDRGQIVTIFPDRGEKYLSTELFA
ncbi:MAG: cysteine synthase family protein [Planctomycetes bacterium]|jgi:cysteine synthase B|nr:cysteine synthase family protein [Planctomycetota bacterium]